MRSILITSLLLFIQCCPALPQIGGVGFWNTPFSIGECTYYDLTILEVEPYLSPTVIIQTMDCNTHQIINDEVEVATAGFWQGCSLIEPRLIDPTGSSEIYYVADYPCGAPGPSGPCDRFTINIQNVSSSATWGILVREDCLSGLMVEDTIQLEPYEVIDAEYCTSDPLSMQFLSPGTPLFSFSYLRCCDCPPPPPEPTEWLLEVRFSASNKFRSFGKYSVQYLIGSTYYDAGPWVMMKSGESGYITRSYHTIPASASDIRVKFTSKRYNFWYNRRFRFVTLDGYGGQTMVFNSSTWGFYYTYDFPLYMFPSNNVLLIEGDLLWR